MSKLYTITLSVNYKRATHYLRNEVSLVIIIVIIVHLWTYNRKHR